MKAKSSTMVGRSTARAASSTDSPVKAMTAMREQHLASLEVTKAAQDAFNTRLQGDLSKTTWADPHCKSWYKTADGRITQNWGSHTRDYAAAVAELTLNDYVARPLANAAE